MRSAALVHGVCALPASSTERRRAAAPLSTEPAASACRHGTVIKVDIMLDDEGRSRGFAFVDLELPEEGAKAPEP